MKIERDGKEIELTAEELLEAFREQEQEFRIKDAKNQVEWMREWASKDRFGTVVTARVCKYITENPDRLSELADMYEVDCNVPENDRWESTVYKYVEDCEFTLRSKIIEAIGKLPYSEEKKRAMMASGEFLRRVAVLIFRRGYGKVKAIKSVEKCFVTLIFTGYDKDGCPKYVTETGTEVVDVESVYWKPERLVYGDTYKALSQKNTIYGFYPERKRKEQTA